MNDIVQHIMSLLSLFFFYFNTSDVDGQLKKTLLFLKLGYTRILY